MDDCGAGFRGDFFALVPAAAGVVVAVVEGVAVRVAVVTVVVAVTVSAAVTAAVMRAALGRGEGFFNHEVGVGGAHFCGGVN